MKTKLAYLKKNKRERSKKCLRWFDGFEKKLKGEWRRKRKIGLIWAWGYHMQFSWSRRHATWHVWFAWWKGWERLGIWWFDGASSRAPSQTPSTLLGPPSPFSFISFFSLFIYSTLIFHFFLTPNSFFLFCSSVKHTPSPTT